MNSKIKNILIFVGIGVILFSIYFLFFKKDKVEENLSSNNQEQGVVNTEKRTLDTKSADEIKEILSYVKKINLDISIFSLNSFNNLKDGSKTLTPTGDEGRRNPFAPIEEINTITENTLVNTTNTNNTQIGTDKTKNNLVIPVFPQ